MKLKERLGIAAKDFEIAEKQAAQGIVANYMKTENSVFVAKDNIVLNAEYQDRCNDMLVYGALALAITEILTLITDGLTQIIR